MIKIETLGIFPKDIYMIIIKRCNLKTVSMLECVCKHFRDFSNCCKLLRAYHELRYINSIIKVTSSNVLDVSAIILKSSTCYSSLLKTPYLSVNVELENKGFKGWMKHFEQCYNKSFIVSKSVLGKYYHSHKNDNLKKRIAQDCTKEVLIEKTKWNIKIFYNIYMNEKIYKDMNESIDTRLFFDFIDSCMKTITMPKYKIFDMINNKLELVQIYNNIEHFKQEWEYVWGNK